MNIHLDMDGVIVDFVRGAMEIHKREVPFGEVRWHFYEQLNLSAMEFYAPMGRAFWANLPWTPEGNRLFSALHLAYPNALSLLTSPCETPGCVEGKLDWVRLNLPPGYVGRTVMLRRKEWVASNQSILIDDNENHIDSWRHRGGRSVLVPRPWNRRRQRCDSNGNFDVDALLDEIRNTY